MRFCKIVKIVLCLCSITACTSANNNSSYRVKRQARIVPPNTYGVIRQPVIVPRPVVPLNTVRPRQAVVVRQPNGLQYYTVNPNHYNYIPSQGGYTNGQVLTPTRVTSDGIRDVTTQRNPPSVTVTCELSQTEVSMPGYVCKGQLLFVEDFNTNIDDNDLWTSEIYMPDQPDYPFNVYEKKAQVQDGKLVIRPTTLESEYGIDFVRKSLDLRGRCTASASVDECYREAFGPQILPPIVTAKITTKKSYSFKYGRIDVRAKMPAGDWLIPLIQLEPRDNVYGSMNYESGLIRIACVKGNIEYSKKLYGGVIVGESVPFRNAHLKEKIGSDQWNKDYHNYTVIWDPSGISVYVDGEAMGKVAPQNGFFEEAKMYVNMSPPKTWLQGSLMAPLDQLFYVSIGLDVGGIHEFPDSPRKPWSNGSNKAMLEFWNSREKWYPTWRKDTSALYVDHIRIYAL